jgi:beta-mannosidase
MPLVPMEAEIVARHDDGQRCLLSANVTNRGTTIALLAHLQLRRDGDDERVLPVYYSDNYVSLLPGESRVISIEAALVDLKGEEPRLFIDGWNVISGTNKHGH